MKFQIKERVMRNKRVLFLLVLAIVVGITGWVYFRSSAPRVSGRVHESANQLATGQEELFAPPAPPVPPPPPLEQMRSGIPHLPSHNAV